MRKMEQAKTYKELKVWQNAHELVMHVYELTKQFPKDELFGLTSQLTRAAVSIPSNIAEGFGRWGSNDKARFYNYAEGSLNEIDYQLFLAQELGYAKTDFLTPLREKLKSQLTNYISSIRKD
ncbi:MAG: four helix bundle protein [Rubritalea sp.]|jgi:four helix bundle protein